MPSAVPVDYDPFADGNMPEYGGLSAIDSADINPIVRQRPVSVDPLANAPELKGGNLNPYTPTWRDTVGGFIAGDSDRFSGRRDFAGKLVGSTGIPTGQLNMADLTPLGGVFGAQEAAQRGDYKGAALAGLMALPGAGALEKGAVGAGERAISKAVPVEGDPFFIGYHGSPHDFAPTSDNPLGAFDWSKIGTGEGTQSRGYGHYIAGNEKVAQRYRDLLSKPIASESANDTAKYWLNEAGNDSAKADALYREFAKSSGLDQQATEEMSHLILNQPGKTYQVAVKGHPNDFLDWDKPVSEQLPRVQEALRSIPGWENHIGASSESNVGDLINRGLLPATYDKASENFAKTYREAGIPGIKFLDSGSRGTGAGTHNYVAFSDDILSILKKYGLAGLGIGAGASLSQQDGGGADGGSNR